jgi:glycosyltransferase involved in cell wall biosynthesis
MGKKTLTVSIAAYNVEKFLENTLKSLEISELLNELEVFVIDDGGKDGSLEIARHFQEKYPDTIHAIHKENGGYGSTVAYSIAHATGKYFKLLDGDDWFDKEGLLQIIKRLRTCEADIIITDYYCGPDNDNLRLMSCHHSNETVMDVKDCKTVFTYGMWSIFYKTSLLQESKMEFPLHTLYTDQIYSTVPFAYAKKIQFTPIPVYCYRFGRDEQSTSRLSRVKHASDMFKVCDILYDFYEKYKKDNTEYKEYILTRISRYYVNAVRTILLMPVNQENKEQLITYEQKNRKEHPDIYYAAAKSNDMGKLIFLMRKTRYLAYWLTKMIPEEKMNF